MEENKIVEPEVVVNDSAPEKFNAVDHYGALTKVYNQMADDPKLAGSLAKFGQRKAKHVGVFTKKKRDVKLSRKRERTARTEMRRKSRNK